MKRLEAGSRNLLRVTGLSACVLLGGCSLGEFPAATELAPAPLVQTPRNFAAALKQNQDAVRERRGAQDVALYNIGVIFAHPANPRKDPVKAASSFHALIAEHPRSPYAEQARTWLQVLDHQQKLTEERQKLAEERRALNRERELLAQERQKLNYASERSQQLDMEIEKRRRQSFSR